MSELTKEDKKRYKEAIKDNNDIGDSIVFAISLLLFMFSFFMVLVLGIIMSPKFILLMCISMVVSAISCNYLVLKEKYILMKKAEDGDLLCKKKN